MNEDFRNIIRLPVEDIEGMMMTFQETREANGLVHIRRRLICDPGSRGEV